VTPEGRGHTGPSAPATTRHSSTQPGRAAPNDRHPANGHHREPPSGRPTAHLNPYRTPIYTSLLAHYTPESRRGSTPTSSDMTLDYHTNGMSFFVRSLYPA